jgi:hypothetical protein
MVGFNQEVSSSVPALMMIRPGNGGSREMIGDPHSGQKIRNTGSPLSALSLKVFVVPSIEKAVSGTTTTIEKALPACF